MRPAWVLTLCAAGVVVNAARCQETPEITIQPITYAELGKEVLKHRGKVVVVDCWFVGCLPCYEGMKHLVQLKEKHSRDGLVALTLCINFVDVDWKDYEKEAGKMLKQLKISADNYLLKLDYREAEKKMQLPGGFPTVFVFNRQGKWKQFSGEQVGKESDKWILEFLKEK